MTETRTRILRASLLLLTISASAAGARAADAPPDLARLKFDVVTDPAKLPAAVQKAWAAKLGQPKLEVAPAGAPFQVTDVIMDPTLPGHRLINAGVSAKYAVVHYESGGVAHSRHVLVFATEGDATTIVWSRYVNHTYDDAQAFLAAIRSGDLFAPPKQGKVQ
ncbi:MAG: hypothetical protein ACREBE_21555 [bacterium]